MGSVRIETVDHDLLLCPLYREHLNENEVALSQKDISSRDSDVQCLRYLLEIGQD